MAADRQAVILNKLKSLGYADPNEPIKPGKSDNEMDAERDSLHDTIKNLDMANKDLLFLGAISSFPFFRSLLRKLRSIEVLKISEDKQQLARKGSKGQVSDPESPIRLPIAVTSSSQSKDVVVFNYVSNHLDTLSLRKVLEQAVNALRDDGILVMREYLPGNTRGDELHDRFHFHDPADTCSLINSVTSSTESDGFLLENALSPDPETIGNKTEMTWILRKVKGDTPAKKLQEFLDGVQYAKKGILKYEKIFGHRYVSTGGEKTTSEFCGLLSLQPGQKVLDVGCGIGGSAFYMAQEYGVSVHGMDLSSNMISIALDRRRAGGFHGVEFEIANVLTRDYPPNSFDYVYSRDVILHIADKRKLFQDFYKWLKPGGKVFITDYCCGDKEHSQDFKDYVEQRGYILLTVPAYGKLLEEAGFVKVRAEDRTQQFISILHNELRKFEPQQSEFVEEFSVEDYNDIVEGWNGKVKRCHAGDQAWGLFLAEKLT